ncbi:MAG: rod shape-determining protein, partial [Candidatus Omnitrophica bacterium]|nr:rod shape-determining protein [Candidatus Omnitrophota bacterium]
IEYLKKTYNLMVGERSAEDIKIKIGSAYPLEEEMSMEVKGRDLIAGLPKMVTVTSEEIREALQEPVRAVLESTKISLERTPPELAADLIEHGIVMAGGGSLLKGLDKLISEETGLPVHVADDPLTAVANGTGKVLNEIRYLKKVTVPVKSEIRT